MADIIHLIDYPKITYGDSISGEDGWMIVGTESDSQVVALLLATMPATLDVDGTQLVLQSFTPVHQGGGVWEATVKYGQRKQDGSTSDEGDAGTGSSITFEISAQSQRITQALFTRQSVAIAGVNVPQMDNAIGWDGEKVNGIDLPVTSGFQWTETRIMPASQITLGYLKTLRDLLLTVNLETFRGMAPEEVLFLGCSGSSQDAQRYEVSFKFAGQQGKTGIQIGDIQGINKKGWDYLDIYYQPRVANNFLAPRPIWVRVLRIFENEDFTQLGIGTGGNP